MTQYRDVGPSRQDEITPQRAWFDMRRLGQRVGDALRTPGAAAIVFGSLAVLGFFAPALGDLMFAMGAGLSLFIRHAQRQYTLPAKMPRHSGLIDPLELHPTGKRLPAKGAFFLGNDRLTGEEVWLTNRDAGVHMLVLGTTGSGKTEMLLGICQNALNQGSGFMFVDGKAQDKIAFKIMDLVRARGRDDDALFLNFMTGARDIIGPQPSKITNTMNPFSYGSSGMVSQIVVGLMSSGSGGDDMWKDRAISFIEGLSPPLTYMRDQHGLILDVNEYRKYFELDRIEELCWKGNEKYPGINQVLEPLKNYLLNLPGYDRNKFGKRGGQGDDTKLQHGYITMQLVRAFTSLADTYGHIVRVPLGEVYFPDLVKNRRILVVMLPSLEKTPSETANIGKIIVTALRNIMSEGLGAKLEGDRKDLDDEEGRALLPPYVVILDEYGYYAVKGFAVAFAQARSLGYVCVVGGQDLASFQRESKEEAVSICGNTRVKAFGSIEDPEQTMKFVVETAGKATVGKSSGYEAHIGGFNTRFADNLNVHFDTIDRINPTDIKNQTEGQFTFVWRARVIRANTYFVDPKKVRRVRLNHFLQVPPPDALQLDEIEMASSALARRLASVCLAEMIETTTVREIDALRDALDISRDLGPVERGIFAVTSVGNERERYIRNFRNAVRGGRGSENEPEVLKRIRELDPRTAAADGDEELVDYAAESVMHHVDPIEPGEGPVAAPVAGMPAGTMLGGVTPEDSVGFEQMNVFVPARRTGFGADVFDADSAHARSIEAALAAADSDIAPMLDKNLTLKGMESLERAMGATPEEAGAAARQVVQTIEDATAYPQSVPREKSADDVSHLLGDLLTALEDN